MIGVDCVCDGFNFFEHRVKVARHSDAANRLDPDAITTEKAACTEGKLTTHRIGARVKALEAENFQVCSALGLRFSGAAGCNGHVARGNP